MAHFFVFVKLDKGDAALDALDPDLMLRGFETTVDQQTTAGVSRYALPPGVYHAFALASPDEIAAAVGESLRKLELIGAVVVIEADADRMSAIGLARVRIPS